MNKNLGVIILLCSALIIGCDTEKFLGYNYDAEKFTETAFVSGKVTNKFTDKPVKEATIQIGQQRSLTNDLGFFTMDYILTEDAKLNKEIPITVSAEDYHSLTSSRVITPDSIEIDFRLEFAAPIIEATVNFQLTYCQAIIFDYQGINNIDTVFAHFQYVNSSTFLVVREFDAGLEQKQVVSENRGYYQTTVVPSVIENNDTLFLSPTYTITAKDKSGFSDVKVHTNNSFNPDTLLFPNNLGGGSL